MRVSTKRAPTAEDVRRVALAALAAALEERKDEVKEKPGLTGVRAVATGAVLYTAGRAILTGRRFVRDHFGTEAEEEYDEPDARADEDDDEYDEPEAGAEDEEYDEDEEDQEDFDEDDEPDGDEDDDRPSLERPAAPGRRSAATDEPAS